MLRSKFCSFQDNSLLFRDAAAAYLGAAAAYLGAAAAYLGAAAANLVNSENKANSAQLELELGLSLAKLDRLLVY